MMIRHLVDRLQGAVTREGAQEALVVTKAPVNIPQHLLEGHSVRVMTLEELREYLGRKGT